MFSLKLHTLTSCSTSVPKSSVTLDFPQPIMVHNWLVGKGCFGAGRHAIPLEGDGVKVTGKRSRATSLSTVSTSYSGWMITESTYMVIELISGGTKKNCRSSFWMRHIPWALILCLLSLLNRALQCERKGVFECNARQLVPTLGIPVFHRKKHPGRRKAINSSPDNIKPFSSFRQFVSVHFYYLLLVGVWGLSSRTYPTSI